MVSVAINSDSVWVAGLMVNIKSIRKFIMVWFFGWIEFMKI
jgi:hypothetical protein